MEINDVSAEIARNVLEKALEKSGAELFEGMQILENNSSVLSIFKIPNSLDGEYNIKNGNVLVVIPHQDKPNRCFLCDETETLLKTIFDADLRWNPDLEIPTFLQTPFDGSQIF